MAHLFPPIETIYSFKIKPTEGELHLLQFLNDNLDDSYEIYFQPWINGDNPDIVVMRKNSGVMIIEVKDWRLEEYSLDDKKNWILLSDKTVIKSPLFQVLSYKNNLFDLHIDNLCKIYMYKKDMFSIVSLGIYFHNAKENEINCFIRNKFLNDSKYIKNLNYFDLLGRDSLSKKNLDNIIQNRRLNKNSKLFTNEIYDSFKRYLQPSEHTIELGKIIQYNKEQTELINNNLKEQKIKGIAGSGKTKVLAKKAVKFHTETNEKVLILCYNIALRNYIRDKISEVRENFNWSAFEISHYHDFITQQMNNYNIVFEFPDNFDELSKSERNEFFNSYYSDINLFEKVEEKIKKYSAVLIDETQDFPIEWLRIIKKYFLKKNGYYILFADEKQNLYNNPLETDSNFGNDRKPKTNIGGRWNESLKQSFRLSKSISDLANNFQSVFFKSKYYLDNIRVPEDSFFKYGSIKYSSFKNDINADLITDFIIEEMKTLKIHPNDICILSFKIDELVNIDYKLRIKSHEKTLTTVENLEIKDVIEKKCRGEMHHIQFNNKKENSFSESDKMIKIKNSVDRELEKIRKNKRFHFNMNSGFMKLSTVHSFKGWEIKTLFLIIDKESESLNEEIIYTGLTRCRENLIIINKGNIQYDNFFRKFVTH